jgi:hypothetical protein
MQEPIGSVDAIAELPDLGADEPIGGGIAMRAIDVDHLAVMNCDGEAARIRAVEWTG